MAPVFRAPSHLVPAWDWSPKKVRKYSRCGQNCSESKTPQSVQLRIGIYTLPHLTERLPWYLPKVVGVVSCGFLLCLGLSHAAQADNAASAKDEMKTGQSERKVVQAGQKKMGDQDKLKGGHSEGSKTSTGEGLSVESDNSFVKGQDGKDVRLRTDQSTDQTTKKTGDSTRGTDVGNGNEGGRKTDSPLESGKPGSMGQ